MQLKRLQNKKRGSTWHVTGIKSLLTYNPPTTEEYWYSKQARQDAGLRELWTAVIEEGRDCLRGNVVGYMNKRDRIYRNAVIKEARKWFVRDSTTAGSFLWVCEVLDLDAQEIRAGLSDCGYL